MGLAPIVGPPTVCVPEGHSKIAQRFIRSNFAARPSHEEIVQLSRRYQAWILAKRPPRVLGIRTECAMLYFLNARRPVE